MEKVVIVIDTNVWGNIMHVFDILKQKINLNENQLWGNSNQIGSHLTEEQQMFYKGPIAIIKRISELKNNPGSSKFEIHVPSFVYNEVAFSLSSKITNRSQKNTNFQKRFDNFLSQLPIKTVVDKTELVQGRDYPNKPANPTNIESHMEIFLQDEQKHNRNLDDLLNHLSRADKSIKETVNQRTEHLKKLNTDIRYKTKFWDKPISDKLKAKHISYSTKAGQIDSLYGKILEYPDVRKVSFGPDPRKIVAKRLTMNKEEFDFFDLQIYLYSKEKKAHILTMNTQAFQEINNPYFLGHFQELKVMHPLINFESTESLHNSGNFVEIVKFSIEDDFKNDIKILSKFDEELNAPIFREPVKKTIEKIILDFTSKNKMLKNIVEEQPLSSALEVLSIDNKQLKLSKKLVFSNLNSANKLPVLLFIDKEFFKGHLSFSDFIIDSDLLKPSTLGNIINQKSIQEKLSHFITQHEKNLREFLNIYKKKGPEVDEYFKTLFIESHFKKEDIEQQLKAAPRYSRKMPVKKCPSCSRSLRKREISESLLNLEDIEEIAEGKLVKMSPEKVKINSEKFLRYVNTIKDPQERIQLIQFADQIINSGGAHEGKISGSKVSEMTRLINQPFRNFVSSNIELTYDNQFTPSKYPNIKWERTRADNPADGKVFCAPGWETASPSVTYTCYDAIGIEDGYKTKNYTLFNLGDGDDVINGFTDTPNIYRIGSGIKEITGGNFDDVFIFEKGLNIDNFPTGKINGLEGINMVDLANIQSYDVRVQFEDEPIGKKIKLREKMNGVLVFKEIEMEFQNLNGVLGRPDAPDYIFSMCSTKYINGRGGTPQIYDFLDIKDYYTMNIPSRKECVHDKIVHLGPNTLLKNNALVGKFSYFINDVYSNINCTLLLYTYPLERIAKPNDAKNDRGQQNFFLNCSLFDIEDIKFTHKKNNYYDLDIYFVFTDKQGISKGLNINVVLGNERNNSGRIDTIKFYLKDRTELRCHNDGLYALLKSDKSVHDIVMTYKPVSNKLRMSLFILAESENAAISIGSDSRDDILYNDPRHTSHLVGNKGNNVYIIASGKNSIYGTKSPQIPDINIYNSDGPNQTNTLDLRQLSQQTKKDLGKGLFLKHVFDEEKLVIYLFTVQTKSGCPRGSLCNTYHNVTSIIFRNTRKVSRWDVWCNRLHVILNNAPVVLKCGDSYQSELNKNLEVIDQYKDVNNYNPSNYYTPIPLVFTDYEIIAIGEQDIEPDTEVIIRKELGKYRVLRHNDDLVLTNGFDFNVTSYYPVSVILKNFYQSSGIFYTLTVKFNDQTVYLRNERQGIENAKTLSDLYNVHNGYINNNTKRRTKKGVKKTVDENRFNSGSLRTVMNSILDYCNGPFTRISDYFKSIVTSTPSQPQIQWHDTTVGLLQKDNTFSNKPKIDPKPNIDTSDTNNNQISNINSTLLLLDVIVRRLNDSKYKLPTDEYFVSQEEIMENNILSLTTSLGLDPDDIVGSLEEKHQQLLAGMDIGNEESENGEVTYRQYVED